MKKVPPATHGLPDAADRTAAIHERKRNVLIDAGAGTGKTTILVSRLVDLVAPDDDTQAPLAINRLAAVTFTRKTAGELRLRVREHLLAVLARDDASAVRRDRLRAALRGLDSAAIGTIHGFADRLLRLRPMEAGISPQYEIADEIDELVADTREALIHGAERGGLAALLADAPAEVRARAAEADETVRLYVNAGLNTHEREYGFQVIPGLDSLIRGFAEHRDQPPSDPALPTPDLAKFRAAARVFIAEVGQLAGDSKGVAWLRDRAGTIAELVDEADGAALFARLRKRLKRPSNPTYRLGEEFGKDRAAWAAWNRLMVPDKKAAAPAVVVQMLGPFEAWLAARLVRMFGVVVALYERAKARRRVLDQTDLLLKLRDLLRDSQAVRAEYQKLFDHILVDEFQDTDPLQAEILVYLCRREDGTPPRSWTDGTLRPGALTLVGDPKQSIYRFRRADITTYDQAQTMVARGPHLRTRLRTNFRSRPNLIEFVNDRFEKILGRAPDDAHLFDAATGTVFYQPLTAGRATPPGKKAPSVHVIPVVAEDPNDPVDTYRALEGAAMARYLRWLVKKSGLQVADRSDTKERDVTYGDIAVLAFSTMTLQFLFTGLDELGVPYASRGGRLFLSDPLHRQFLLALRAVADRNDGVAQAALLRPPFFAVDLAQWVHERADTDGSDRAADGAREAAALVADLRMRRFTRSPGDTARDLLEQTAFGRHVALGPNGAQRLARLRELCLQLDKLAAEEGLDYDAATLRMRAWVKDPIRLDPPHPVGTDAVQVVTVHQSKGLEWPVVVMWDGCVKIEDRDRPLVWRATNGGTDWVMKLEGLTCEYPTEGGLGPRELAFQQAERMRLVYVATTRARDRLVLATPSQKAGNFISGLLLKDVPNDLIHRMAPYDHQDGAAWASDIATHPAPSALVGKGNRLEDDLAARWQVAIADSARPRFQPRAISSHATTFVPSVVAAGHGQQDDGDGEGVGDGEPVLQRRPRVSRYGPVFGETVHRAIGIMLRAEATDPAAAVARAAASTGLSDQEAEAARDVAFALTALHALGVVSPVASFGTTVVRLEYPLAASTEEGTLLLGYADLVFANGDDVTVIDFKTDAPPSQSGEGAYPEYLEQVRTYALILDGRRAQPRPARAGLLFTASGDVHWAV